MQFVGIAAWFTLPDIPISVPKGYLLLKNVFWGSVSLIAAVALFIRCSWAPKLTYIGAIAYAAWLAIDHLLFQRSDFASSSFPFTFGAMTLCFLIVIWVLTRPSVRRYYEE